MDIAAVAALIGEPARADVLVALADGRALSASTLAAEAGVAASTISAHLSRLVDAGLVEVEPSGRHRYYRLAGPDIAEALEALARVAPTREVRSLRQATHAEAMRKARSCYDHLAGRLGVALCDAMVRDGVVEDTKQPDSSVKFGLTDVGRSRLADFGVDLDRPSRRPMVRSCLDWTERRPHLAGVLGVGLLERFFALGWLVRGEHRVLRVTDPGRTGFVEQLGIPVGAVD